ncbi:tetratricopeptide repeat protein [Paludisphaera mucosa]|uniref:Uncharacterized protein n=1 Tax=Paludisphaera mucosa TaxID=3030827 RepID=A0ABT6F762_9BACT|nr:hypothetical protein [Paludisphaera mucosa]MDG3003399.1 hypothetical protein [Paludisphaera mucosa]
MKNEPTPHHNPGAASPARHQFEHATPTVIHDPEQDMMLLARWVHRAMQDPARFWGWVGGVTAAVLALVVVVNLFAARTGVQNNVWGKLDEARTADDEIEVAKANPQSPAAPWALLQAASRLYTSGVSDLPSNSDAALPTLKKALDLFDQLGKSEPKDSPIAVAAAFGKARALEARNELPKAVDQYKFVADTWPDSAEAVEAKKLAAALQKPDAADFYKQLYAYKPTKVSLPPGGSESLDFPAVVPAPPTDAVSPGSLVIPPPPSDAAKPEAPKADAPKPEEPKAAPKVEEPKAEPAKPEEPKSEAPKPEPAAPAEAPKPETTPAPSEAPKAEAAPAPAPAEAPKPEAPKS